MKRLFYFTGYRLSVLHWKGREMIGSTSFEPTTEGLAQFRSYLQETANIPGRFMVDVIEEDFRIEQIPHVGSRDRQAVISRLIDRHYRASKEFCYSEVIGRRKDGRKDDELLLGAMTNPQLMKPWLDIIDSCEVALSGIWTLPLVSRDLLKTLKACEGVVLLVSQQVNSNVRQTLFRNGKLLSSRQSIINQDMDDISEIGRLAAPEVSRTIDFLRAQGLIGSDESIDLHVLGSEEQTDSLRQAFRDDEGQKVHIHLISQLQDKLGIRGVDSRFADGLFAWLCNRRLFSRGHYGSRELFTRYYHRLSGNLLYAASVAVIILAILTSVSNVLDSVEYHESAQLLKQEERSYKELYASKFKAFEEVFENAGIMNAAVELEQRIRRNSDTSPLDFLIEISRVLDRHGMDGIHIDKISWKAVNIDKKKERTEQANFTGSEAVLHDAVVSGRIDEPEHNYRESVEHILRIIRQLQSSPRIEQVEALKMPVDLRSHSRFATQAGLESGKDESAHGGRFSLHIIMRGPYHD